MQTLSEAITAATHASLRIITKMPSQNPSSFSKAKGQANSLLTRECLGGKILALLMAHKHMYFPYISSPFIPRFLLKKFDNISGKFAKD